MLSSVVTNFDVELLLSSKGVARIVQLLQDVGVVPREIQTGVDNDGDPIFSTLSAILENEEFNAEEFRLYDAFPGASYSEENPESFTLFGFEFDDFEPDFTFIGIRIFLNVDLEVRLVFRVLKVIDTQTFFQDLLDFTRQSDQNVTFPIHDFIKCVGILSGDQEFDTENPENNLAPPLNIAAANINAALVDFTTQLRNGEYRNITDFILEQLDVFTMGRIEKIALCAFSEDVLGIYVNFVLTDHDSGFVGDRGDVGVGINFLPEGRDFAIGTSSSFFHHFLDDLLIKAIAMYKLNAKLISEGKARTLVTGTHFPIIVPNSMIMGHKDVEEKIEEVVIINEDGEEEIIEVVIPPTPEELEPASSLSFQIENTNVSTTNHTFEDRNGAKTRNESLKLKLIVNANLANFYRLAEENIIVFATPLISTYQGTSIADLGIGANIRVDGVQSLLNACLAASEWPFFAEGFVKLITIPIVGLVNFFLNKNRNLEEFEGRLGADLGVPFLSRITLDKRRWDPFYTTKHEVLLERGTLMFKDDRCWYTGDIRLSKSFEPFPFVSIREAELAANTTRIESLLYRVESVRLIDDTNQFATDRETFEALEVVEDDEERIFCLAYGNEGTTGSAIHRLGIGKVARYLRYSPYCIQKHIGHNTANADIDLIKLFSEREKTLLRRGFINALIDARVDESMEAIDMQFSLSEEERKTLKRMIRKLIQDSSEVRDYENSEELKDDVAQAIYEAGRLRFALSPLNLDQVIKNRLISLPGYEPVSRASGLYFRGIANQFTKDNLLSLPECT